MEAVLRCYFMRGGHIGAVEVLAEGVSDEAAIRQAEALFVERKKDDFTAFEVWDRARLVHSHPQPLPKFG